MGNGHFVLDRNTVLKELPKQMISEPAFREEMRKLIPDAVKEIRNMLVWSCNTPPAVKTKLIEMVLKYGLEEPKNRE